MVRRWELALMILGPAALLLAAWTRVLPLGMTETLGFVTGAVGVWLTVKQNIWNWPIGIVESVELFLIGRAETGPLLEEPCRRRVEPFAPAHDPARQSPRAGEWLRLALHE